MKNIINEEINKINYLFGYKRGVVISEQTNPVADTKIEYIERLKSEQPESNQSYYNNLINYYKGLDSPDADKNMIDKIDKYFSDTKIPKLPNTEEADLGNAPEEIINALKEKEDKRALGFASSIDKEAAEKKATQKAIYNLNNKLKSQQQQHPVVAIAVQDGVTYVVVGER
jgi:hypothetical protein